MAFEVVDPFAGGQHILHAEAFEASHHPVLLGVLFWSFGEGAELAEVEAIAEGVQVLEQLQQRAFSLPVQRVCLQANDPKLARRAVAAQVAGAAV